MNSIIKFKQKTKMDFFYLKMGDVFKTFENDCIKIFIKGELESIEYIEILKHYKILLKILYYDIKKNKFCEETMRYYSKEKNKITFELVGIYRKLS